jgi:hypothetical protein
LLGLLVLAAGLPLLLLARRDEIEPGQSREGA